MEEEKELSQDDIDSLMNFGGDDDEQDDGGELSQDDIDNLLGRGPSNSQEAGTLTDDGEEEEEGELSQDDIDRMLGKTSAPAPAEKDDDESEPISMDDIQRVMDRARKSPPQDTPAPEAVSPKDPGLDQAPASPSNESDNEDEFIIDPSEAAELEDNLILQEALDALLNGPLEPIAQESVQETSAEVPEDAPEASAADDSAGEPSGEEESPVILEDNNDNSSEDITQEEIESMLKESDDDDQEVLIEDEDDILISQDDINTLLMAVEQEDEDLLGDVDGEPFEFESAAESDMAGPVVLEGMEDSEEESGKEKSGKKPWYASRLFLIAASVLLFVGIAVPSGYFLFFSGNSDSELAPLELSAAQDNLDRYGSDLEIDTDQLGGLRSSGQVVLKGFLVPVSGTSAELAYVQADVFIDYTDQRISDEIQANMAFYRDVVFEAIRENLRGSKKDEVTVAALVWAVETSLKKVLPERFIEKIGFSSFKSG